MKEEEKKKGGGGFKGNLHPLIPPLFLPAALPSAPSLSLPPLPPAHARPRPAPRPHLLGYGTEWNGLPGRLGKGEGRDSGRGGREIGRGDWQKAGGMGGEKVNIYYFLLSYMISTTSTPPLLLRRSLNSNLPHLQLRSAIFFPAGFNHLLHKRRVIDILRRGGVFVPRLFCRPRVRIRGAVAGKDGADADEASYGRYDAAFLKAQFECLRY